MPDLSEARIAEIERQAQEGGIDGRQTFQRSEMRLVLSALRASSPADVLAALVEARRFIEYFAGETDGMFVGPGTPKSCLAQIDAALAGDGPRWRHKKRGTTYRVLHEGTMSSAKVSVVDDEPMVVYQAESDGRIWVRPTAEFYDGRFEVLRRARAARGVVNHET